MGLEEKPKIRILTKLIMILYIWIKKKREKMNMLWKKNLKSKTVWINMMNIFHKEMILDIQQINFHLIQDYNVLQQVKRVQKRKL